VRVSASRFTSGDIIEIVNPADVERDVPFLLDEGQVAPSVENFGQLDDSALRLCHLVPQTRINTVFFRHGLTQINTD